MNRSWIKIPFIYLVIVALLGVLLRMLFLFPVPGVSFKNFLHAHSHVALLGWLYSGFFIALTAAFLNEEEQKKGRFKIQFWLSQVSVLGMLIFFPFQGYAAFSITFSTLHILLSYWFIFSFLKYASINGPTKSIHTLSYSFVKVSLFFMAVSSLGPWALGPIMATGNGGSNLYYLSIYFYLHFQYNGWFTFSLLGLFFWLLEKNHVCYPKKEGRLFFILMFSACIPSYALSTLWTGPDSWVYLLGGFSAAAQLVGLFFFLKLLSAIKRELKHIFQGFSFFLSILILASFAIKLFLQFASSFPLFADLAYKIRNFVIGYLHLTLIGFISLFVFLIFHQMNFINLIRLKSRIGLILFITGFVISEVVLFAQGIMYWQVLGNISYYYQILFFVSLLMPIGAIIFYLGLLRKRGVTD